MNVIHPRMCGFRMLHAIMDIIFGIGTLMTLGCVTFRAQIRFEAWLLHILLWAQRKRECGGNINAP